MGMVGCRLFVSRLLTALRRNSPVSVCQRNPDRHKRRIADVTSTAAGIQPQQYETCDVARNESTTWLAVADLTLTPCCQQQPRCFGPREPAKPCIGSVRQHRTKHHVGAADGILDVEIDRRR